MRNLFKIIIMIATLLPSIALSSRNREITPGQDIQNAINTAEEGDILIFQPGEYLIQKAWVINKKKKLHFVGKDNVKIYLTSRQENILQITESVDIRFSHFQFFSRYPADNNTPVESQQAGIIVQKSELITFVNCIFDGYGAVGFSGSESKNISFSECTFTRFTKTAIEIKSTENFILRKSEIKNNQDSEGVILITENSKIIYLFRNNITENKNGQIRVQNSEKILIRKNLFKANKKALEIRRCIQISLKDNVYIQSGNPPVINENNVQFQEEGNRIE